MLPYSEYHTGHSTGFLNHNDRQIWIIEGGLLEPLWSRGPILPPSLIDVLDIYNNGEESDNEEISDSNDLMEYLDDDNERFISAYILILVSSNIFEMNRTQIAFFL